MKPQLKSFTFKVALTALLCCCAQPAFSRSVLLAQDLSAIQNFGFHCIAGRVASGLSCAGGIFIPAPNGDKAVVIWQRLEGRKAAKYVVAVTQDSTEASGQPRRVLLDALSYQPSKAFADIAYTGDVDCAAADYPGWPVIAVGSWRRRTPTRPIDVLSPISKAWAISPITGVITPVPPFKVSCQQADDRD